MLVFLPIHAGQQLILVLQFLEINVIDTASFLDSVLTEIAALMEKRLFKFCAALRKTH